MSRINLLYYKNILDLALVDFINENNDYFIKEDENYILSKDISYMSIKRSFEKNICLILKKYISEFSIEDPNFYFIIGSCYPKNNILLNFKEDKYFPSKLMKFINSDTQIKYLLREKDIKINLIRLNQVFTEIFNDFFTDRKKLFKCLNKKYENLFFIQNSNLDCYSLFKIIKRVYGKSNCLNMHKEFMKDIQHPIIALNELICKYINNKKELLKSDIFSQKTNDIKRFMDHCMQTCIINN